MNDASAVQVSLRDVRGVQVLLVAGQFDRGSVAVFRQGLVDAVAGAAARSTSLVVDLSGATLDAAAMGALVAARQRLPAGVPLRLVSTSPALLKTLTVTGLRELLPVHDTLAQAIGAQNQLTA